MTLQDFKDQVAREMSKGFWNRWDDFLHDARNRADWIKTFNDYSDRAATLFAEHREREGYNQGFKDATPRSRALTG